MFYGEGCSHGVTVAGVGPGNPKYLTVDVAERIKEAERIVAFGRVSESVKALNSNFIKVSKVEEIIALTNTYENLLLLASGDPNFFGIVEFLKRKGVPIENVLPGISSFQYLASKLQKSWQDAKFISLHGRALSLELIRDYPLIIMLTDKENTANVISKEVHALGIKGNIWAGFNLSYENEEIVAVKIGEVIKNNSELSVVIVENEMDKGL